MSSYTVKTLPHERYADFIDLINLVFSQAHMPHDFEAILPKLYDGSAEVCAQHTVVMRDDGKLVSSIGNFPIPMYIGDTPINCYGIGGVATHIKETGMSHMKAIMTEIDTFYKENNVALSILGGERKRYGRYGFEKAGTSLNYRLTKKNMRDINAMTNNVSLTFAEVTADDADALAFIAKLYDAQPYRFVRPAQKQYAILRTWGAVPYVAKSADGAYAGYMVIGSRHISEIYAVDVTHMAAMIASWIAMHGEVDVTLPPWRMDYIRCIGRFAEGWEASTSYNWRIIDWERVIGALLKLKATMVSLPDGEVRIGIEGYGTLHMSVHGSDVRCAKTDDTPQITMDPLTATRLLCDCVSPAYVVDLPAEVESLLRAWCPLPLYWSSVDAL